MKTKTSTDLEQAVDLLRQNAARCVKTERYYRGDHDLAFATQKFQNAFGSLFREFAMNLCPAVCDAVRDKLKITGFGISGPPEAASTQISQAMTSIWKRNRMDGRSGEVHKEALKNGNAYAIVWPDARGFPVIYPNRASSMAVVYDDDEPGVIRWAAKSWPASDGSLRVNLFYPDRIEKYIAAEPGHGILADAGELVPLAGSETVANPFGRVPVFHFANNADTGMPGISELLPAIPIQDGLNKSVLDMLVAMVFAAYRQRWAAGIDFEFDEATGEPIAPFHAGLDHLWLTSNPNASFGDLGSSDLDQFLKVKESFRVDMACVTGTPLHYLQPSTKGFPSGESLRKAETRFIAKVRDRQTSFGQVWSDVMSFALLVAGKRGDADIVTQWEDPAAVSVREQLENLLLKRRLGLPAAEALTEAGYGAADAARLAEASDGGQE
jgi:hypothetical protein